MAARENQGYLIAVIVLVLLSLVLALLSFLGLSKASENAEAKKALESKVAYLEDLNDANAAKGEILKAVIGDFGPSTAEIQTQIDAITRMSTKSSLEAAQKTSIGAVLIDAQGIKEKYDEDMLGSTSDGGALPTYREKLRNLTQIVAKKNDEYNIQINTTRQAEQDAKTKIAAMEKEVAENQKSKDAALEELASVKKLSLEKEATLQGEVDKLSKNLRTEKTSFTEFQSKKNAEVRSAMDKIAAISKQNESLKTRINRYEREVFDRPDGNIVKVASRLQSVFIDLGSADGLMNNMTFAVYDRSVTNFEEGNHKAMVEVTRVDRYRAEARITMENPTNPILAGDYILTATWDPGFAVPIAVAGSFDLDGDTYDDLEKLVRMIERNGGTVVAKHDSEGNIEGKIDANVRYLVLGKSPQLGINANPAVVDAMRSMEAQAEQNTVQVIGLQKLMNRMGVRAKPKTVQLDERISGFQSRSPGDTSKSDDR